MQNRQALTDVIISDIKRGDYELGDTLSQRKIGERYGCGRWIAMRVLEELEASSWLNSMPDGTYVIAETSRDTLRQAIELRALLETYGASEVMLIADGPLIRRLRLINNEMWRAGQGKDFKAAVNLNRDFHTCLTEAADHGPLSRQLAAVYQIQGFSDETNFQSERAVLQSMQEHARMIFFLKNKDAKRLSNAIHRHILQHLKQPG